MTNAKRLLLVGAGASFSTKDVETGYFEAFSNQGHEMYLYALDRRIEMAAKWLKFRWKFDFNKDPAFKPGWADAIYRAGIEALEMALRFEVDWVIAVSAMYFHPDVIVMMRRAGLKVAVIFTESPYEDEKQAYVARLANVCFTNERISVPILQAANPETYYVRHAYAPTRTSSNRMGGPCEGSSTDEELPSHDVVFVGSGFQERLDLLKSIDWEGEGINLGLYGTWTLLPRRHHLRRYIVKGIIKNSEALELYHKAKIGLNLYRESQLYGRQSPRIIGAESCNPRAYELAASGAFCLTESRLEGDETFGDSQPSFSGPEDLREKVLYYLQDQARREELAKEALKKVRGHTFDQRALQVYYKLVEYEHERELNAGKVPR